MLLSVVVFLCKPLRYFYYIKTYNLFEQINTFVVGRGDGLVGQEMVTVEKY